MPAARRPRLQTCVALAIVIAAGACRGRAPSDPDRERAYGANNRGIALLEQSRYEDAASSFREALAIDGALGIARLNLSLALLHAQDFAGATREAGEAGRLLPSAPQPPYVLGLIARAENRNREAAAFFERVRQMDPRDVGTAVNLAQIHLEQGQYAPATGLLRAAVAEDPFNVTAAYNLGLALVRAGEQAEGQQLLERSQTLRTAGYGIAFGTGYLERGRYAEAVASTGAEPDLVEATQPVQFSPVALTNAAQRATPASPFGQRFQAKALTPDAARAIAAALGGCHAPLDVDRDGDLDVFVASADGQQLLRNGGAWTDASSGLPGAPPNSVPVGCLAGDFDNDGASDLFVLRYGGSSLYRNEGEGRFKDVTPTARLPSYPFLPGAAAWSDTDHDGDLDLLIAGLADLAATRARAPRPDLVFPNDFVPAPVQLLRNNGNGTFTDITREARLQTVGHAVAIVPTDFDNRRDIDLLIINYDAAPALYKNLRAGAFQDVAADVGLSAIAPGAGIAAAATADVNKDDFPDFFFARAGAQGTLALSDGRGRFVLASGPDGSQNAVASQFLDYDNDGLLDLVTTSSGGPRLLRNTGRGWTETAPASISGNRGDRSQGSIPSRAFSVADFDRDGDSDLVTGGSAAPLLWRNEGAGGHRALPVRLTARVSNRQTVGAKLQMRAGSLSARLETSAATPAVAPADVLFGIGRRSAVDTIRVLWPSGILQAETPGAVALTAAAGEARRSFVVEELDRKPSSCPFLFSWNGTRFEFITDFLGGGEMGYWLGPNTWHTPDPVEYVRIRGDQLVPAEGRLDLRLTNELEEAIFLDRVQLVAVAHPRDIDIYPNEGMANPPKPFRLHAVQDSRVPRAVDDHGHDVTDIIARLDRRYPDDFALRPLRGYAETHTLTLDLGAVDGPATLLLTGWTDYAFSSDNVAAHQAGLALAVPSLHIKDRAGRWRTAIADIGIPVGRPQTIALDLSGHLRPGEREVRVVTSMRVYWDQILVGRSVAPDRVTTSRLDPRAATLRWRGFSAIVRPTVKEPESYEYERVTLVSPWKVMRGTYTREGDVRPLLTQSDDMFVIAKPGDEIGISFDAAGLGSLPDGWTRTFLLFADGYSKEMDINSASPDAVEPLPFHRMSGYPYAPPEAYPDTPLHREYRARYNTRSVTKELPFLVK